jgi:hypothetical protein
VTLARSTTGVREGGSGMEYYSIPRLQNINTLYIYIYSTNVPAPVRILIVSIC